LTEEDIETMRKEIDGEIKSGEVKDPEEEEEEKKEQKPVPVQVVPEKPPESEAERQKKAEKEKEKQERYIPSVEDELLEEMTRYMAKVNEQD
jgi:hypothetical protein